MIVVVLIGVQGSMVLLYDYANRTSDMISHKLWLRLHETWGRNTTLKPQGCSWDGRAILGMRLKSTTHYKAPFNVCAFPPLIELIPHLFFLIYEIGLFYYRPYNNVFCIYSFRCSLLILVCGLWKELIMSFYFISYTVNTTHLPCTCFLSNTYCSILPLAL